MTTQPAATFVSSDREQHDKVTHAPPVTRSACAHDPRLTLTHTHDLTRRRRATPSKPTCSHLLPRGFHAQLTPPAGAAHTSDTRLIPARTELSEPEPVQSRTWIVTPLAPFATPYLRPTPRDTVCEGSQRTHSTRGVQVPCVQAGLLGRRGARVADGSGGNVRAVAGIAIVRRGDNALVDPIGATVGQALAPVRPCNAERVQLKGTPGR